jgi:hypothetical protein
MATRKLAWNHHDGYDDSTLMSLWGDYTSLACQMQSLRLIAEVLMELNRKGATGEQVAALDALLPTSVQLIRIIDELNDRLQAFAIPAHAGTDAA